jgi:hypothetical protein
MCDIIYITDNSSIEQMLNFKNLMTPNINNNEQSKQCIGGEYYIQTCLFSILEKYFKNNYTTLILTENIEYITNILNNCKIIILPGWMNDINETSILYNYCDKILSYTYCNKKYKNIKNLCSHKFNNDCTPLYYYMLPINLTDENIILNNNIKGLLMGKCVSHNIKIINEIKNILDVLDNNNIKLFSTMRNLKNMDIFPKYLNDNKEAYINASELIYNHNSIYPLNILTPTKFRKLLIHCKYILCFDNPRYPPTIIEALFSNCIVISRSNQISLDLQQNKNIYLTDNMTNDEILLLIQKIENDEILFDKNEYPTNYTEENVTSILNNLIK